jgi:RimJ/RimL family protein N-acetyltransferase
MIPSIVTTRLKLVPATVAHVRAEICDRIEFARLIQAMIPENWPPESAADALPLFLKWLEAAPDRVGWFGWYVLAQSDGANVPVLVGSCGFLGPPRDGDVNIGYSVLPQFQRRGFATEMIGGLVHWALEQPAVIRIVAETEWANPASLRVLTKLGFAAVGPSADQRGTRFELSRSAEI